MGDKKDEIKQERLFRRVDKTPISKTCNESMGIDFADYGDQETFTHARDTLSRYTTLKFTGYKTNAGRSDGRVVNAVLKIG